MFNVTLHRHQVLTYPPTFKEIKQVKVIGKPVVSLDHKEAIKQKTKARQGVKYFFKE